MMASHSSPSSPLSSCSCDKYNIVVGVVIILTAFTLPVRGNTPPQLKNPGVLILPEDTPVGTIIGNLTAVDADGPAPLRFRDTDTDDINDRLVRLSEPRKLDTITWIVDIILNRPLDRDFEPSDRKLYFLIDDSTSEIPARISLFIKDVNDERPQFKNLPYKPVVNESVAPGSVVFTGVRADDPDNGRGGTVTYSLVTDAQAADEEYRTTFAIEPQTGVITVKKKLDYEKHNYYQFKIKAVDGEGLEGVPADLLIEVIDVQDTPPYFVNLPYSVEVDENVTVGAAIHQVAGLDGDRGIPNSLVYRFLPGLDEHFSIDADTGWITVKSPLDSDDPRVRNRGGVYAMYVEASEVVPAGQVNNGATSATTLVTITVRDINDNTPTFSNTSYDATILENMQNNVPITFMGGVMRVSDADQGTNSHFTLSIQQNGQPFQEFTTLPQEVFSESTVLIRVNSSQDLDYEERKYIIFEVVAREIDTVERRSSTATVTLHIEDMNDNVPVFTNESYHLFVKEDAPVNSSIITLEASDKDSGVFGEVSYSIRGGNKRFRIDSSTGTIYVAAALDREETDDYYLTAEARDGGGLRTPTEVTIGVLDVNDNAPQFRRKDYEATVREGDSDFLRPLIVEAIDDDEADSVNSKVHYRIERVTAGLESNFSINELTGHITLTEPLDYEKLDTSIGGKVTLEVKAFDMGEPSLSTSVFVSITVEDINDNTPSFVQSVYSKLLLENATRGSSILKVKAFDFDGTSPNNDFIFRIESGALDKFRMDFATGDIYVETGARLDRETKNVYTMNISAIDKGTPPRTGHAVVVVQLSDVNDELPVFRLQRMSTTVQENAEVYSLVSSLLAEDPDLNAKLEYSVDLVKAYDDHNEEVDIRENNLKDFFGIIPSNGSIFVASELDRERAERFILKITVSDLNAWYPDEAAVKQTATATLTVTLEDFNDNAPVFKPSNVYHANISEGQDIDSEALRVETFDPDKNQIVTYQIQNAETSAFRINPNTGIIRVKNKLDREAHTDLTFIVIATDNGVPAMSSLATVYVRLLDVNDNNPKFPAHPSLYHVSEDAAIGHVVTTITGTDADVGHFGALFYTLSGVDNDGTFSIIEDTGEITVTKPLDRERKKTYTLDVVAWDNKKDASNRRSNRTSIRINIDDVNDNAPQFAPIGFQSIPESSPLGTSVYKVIAKDADFGENATIEYSLGDDTNATNARGQLIFSIGETSGIIYVKSDLHNTVGLRYVTVFAKDKGIEPLSNSTQVFLQILDVNDDTPRFVTPDPNNPIVVIEEDQPPGTPIITLVANDDDFGRNGEVVYTLVKTESRLDWKKFALNRVTGLLTNRVVLDRETQEYHELIVRATDRGLPRNYSTDLTLTVRVLDVNDQPPRFDRKKYPKPYQVKVVEESSSACAGNVGIAVDDDINLNYTIICYYLWAVELENTFTLDKSGALCLRRKLNREEQPFTYVIIRASPDCYEKVTPKIFTHSPITPDPPIQVYEDSNHTLLWVNVTIEDINDNAPHFHRKDLALGVTRNTQFGRIILELTTEASDEDTAKWGIGTFNTTGPLEVRPDSLQNQLAEMGIKQPFLFFPNGSVKTNTYFKPNMYGFFRVPIMVRDKGGLTDTATLRISLINDDQRLMVVFRRRIEAVYIKQEGEEGAVKDIFPIRLRNVTGYRIVVDKIQTHQNGQGKPEFEKTDMLIHGEDPKTDEVVPAEELLKSIDFNAEFMIGILNDYNIERIVPTSSGEEDRTVEKELKMAVILISVILGMIIVVLVATFYTSRKKYMRKLKAATAMAYGSQESDLYKLEMPGTNIHSYENGVMLDPMQETSAGANPIYLEKIMLDHADDDGINSLDENAIQHNRPYDEQEVSMNIFPEDKENTQSQRMKDLYLKAALNEHETSRNLKNHDMSKKFQNGNGKLKITNGHAHGHDGEAITTRNVDGLQTTEI